MWNEIEIHRIGRIFYDNNDVRISFLMINTSFIVSLIANMAADRLIRSRIDWFGPMEEEFSLVIQLFGLWRLSAAFVIVAHIIEKKKKNKKQTVPANLISR